MSSITKAKHIYKKLKADERIDSLKLKDEWNYNIPFSLLKKYNLKFRYFSFKDEIIPSYENMACSFDKNLLFKYGKYMASIALKNNTNCLLEPNIKIKRNPLIYTNSFSEDPIHSAFMSSELINGINSLGALSIPRSEVGSIDYILSSNIDNKALNEIYLRNYNIIQEKTNNKAFLLPSNRLNRNKINEKEEYLDSETLFISNKYATNNLNLNYNISNLSLDNDLRLIGINQDILKKNSIKNIKFLIENGKINNKKLIEEKLNEIDSTASSTILLRNQEEILPLLPTDKILLIGSLSNDNSLQNLKEYLDSMKIKYGYKKGYEDNFEPNKKLIMEAVDEINNYDKIILFINNNNASNKDLKLNKTIEDLFGQIYLLNKNIICVIETKKPVEFSFSNILKGLIVSYPNPFFHKTISYILYGFVSPSGRLIESWPEQLNKSPVASIKNHDLLNENYLESIYIGYRYYDKVQKDALFKFGEGLSYSKFKILSIKKNLSKNIINFKIKVKNIGDYDSYIPLLIYYEVLDSKTFKENKSLIDFDKKFIKSNGIQEFIFNIDLNNLSSYDFKENKMIIENAQYKFYFGFSSNNLDNELTITINSGSNFSEDYKNVYSYYNNIRNNKFTLSNFNSLCNFEFFKEKREANIDSLLIELTNKEEDLKNELLNQIEYFKSKNEDKINIIDKDLLKLPIRVLNRKYKLMDVSTLESYFKGE